MSRPREYRYIEHPREKIKEIDEVRTPFVINEQGDWDALHESLDALYKKIQKKNGVPKEQIEEFREQEKDLIAGAVNLINFLLWKREQGEEIQTLLFLDKAARNASYLFSLLWKQLGQFSLQQSMGQVWPEMPQIRFLNVGKDEFAKHEDQKAYEELSSVFQPSDFQGRVLIVDEIISSGGSSKRAGEALLDAGYTPESLEAVGNFVYMPKWYFDDAVKGVDDIGNISLETRVVADRIDDDDANLLKRVIRRIGWEKLRKLVEPASLGSLIRGLRFQHDDEVTQAINLVKRCTSQNRAVSADELIRYFAAAGGFLGLSPSKEHIQATRIFRTVLKEMVKKSVDNGLVAMR